MGVAGEGVEREKQGVRRLLTSSHRHGEKGGTQLEIEISLTLTLEEPFSH